MSLLENLKITDAHVHIWDTEQLTYPWLEEVPAINKTFLPLHYLEESQAFPLEKLVFVQCECLPESYLEEVKWVTKMAGDDTRFKGIVAYCPIEKGEGASAQLEALKEYPLVKGIRRMYAESKTLCTSPSFIAGLKILPAYGYTFDICIKHFQMEETIEMVKQCPDVAFMLDHIGKPGIMEGLLDQWKKDINTLAAFPNVHCKISGVITEADPENWTTEQIKPYILHAIEAFGIDRVCFGGDWPVAKLAGGYTRWMASLMEILSGFNDGEYQKLFTTNANNFYKI